MPRLKGTEHNVQETEKAREKKYKKMYHDKRIVVDTVFLWNVQQITSQPNNIWHQYFRNGKATISALSATPRDNSQEKKPERSN